MDNAVALVETYLRINGYLTVSEYPVLEATRLSKPRVVTDLDILAFRFPGAGRFVPGSGEKTAWNFEPDVRLRCEPGRPDMLIGEVKEGRARLNPGVRNPDVLRAVLVRFGCCPAGKVIPVVESLRRHGQAITPRGHHVRIVAFGSGDGSRNGHVHTVVNLDHVIRFLRDYMREHWDVLRHAQFKDPVLGFLMLLEKADEERSRSRPGSRVEARSVVKAD